MVKNNIPVNFTDEFGFMNRAELTCERSSTSSIEAGCEVTHKRVVLSGLWSDTHGETFTISLSPIRALLLVKRLMQTLDEYAREGVELPQLHSSFMNEYDQVVELGHMSPHYSDFCRDIERTSRFTDGELLAEILPPYIQR